MNKIARFQIGNVGFELAAFLAERLTQRLQTLAESLTRGAFLSEKVLLQNVPVTQFLLIFLMNHIEMKNSQDSKLDFEFICSIRISTDFQVMKHSLSSNLLTTE